MLIALWIITGLLAAMFGMAGFMKVITPHASLLEKMPWVEEVSPAQLKAIGVVEFFGAVGMVLPAALGILPWLTPVAALGLFLAMTVAVSMHVRRREPLAPSVVLGTLALIVAAGWMVIA